MAEVDRIDLIETYEVICGLAERADDFGFAMADIVTSVCVLVLLILRPLNE